MVRLYTLHTYHQGFSCHTFYTAEVSYTLQFLLIPYYPFLLISCRVGLPTPYPKHPKPPRFFGVSRPVQHTLWPTIRIPCPNATACTLGALNGVLLTMGGLLATYHTVPNDCIIDSTYKITYWVLRAPSTFTNKILEYHRTLLVLVVIHNVGEVLPHIVQVPQYASRDDPPGNYCHDDPEGVPIHDSFSFM